MKRINRMIRKTILEIAIVISLVFLSIPLWQSFNLSEYETVAMYYDNISYTDLEVSDYSDYVLYQTTDELAIEHIKPINIKLMNDTNTMENYSLWLVVAKDSTLDYKNIKTNFNNKTLLLNEYVMVEDSEYYYFLLEEGTITAESINTSLLLWIDNNIEDDITDKYISFSIENNPGQVL